jgi:Dolichyl-phosphate-mannose-protein mannosyltransferase
MTTVPAFSRFRPDPALRTTHRSPGLPRRTYLAALVGVLAAALAVQLGLFGIGFHRVSFDESARSLMALDLSWANAIEPFVWPPFYKIFVGSFLKLWGDVFLVPRLLAGAAGLLAILALVRLSDLLFGDRRVNLLTAALAVFFPHRLVFSVAPMSDIYGYLFLLLAAGCALAWLRRGSVAQLLLGCACLFGAQTVRYEAGFFALALSALVLHRWLWRRELGFGAVAAAAALLFSFPVLWIANSYLWYGSLENLGITSQQYRAVFGTSRSFALWLSPVGRNLALDLVWNPLMLAGLAALAWTAWRDTAARAWALAFGVPFVLITAAMVLSLSIPMAAPWRTTGIWALLLLPFEALAILRLAAWLGDRLGRGRGRAGGVAIAALLAVALLPPAARSAVYAREGMRDIRTGHWREERAAGLHVAGELARSGGGKAVVDSANNLDFLDVLAGSGEPWRFVLSHGTDPQLVATGSAEGYPSEDRFGLAGGGGSAEAFAAEDVRLLLVREPRLVGALDAGRRWERARAFGPWVLFRPRGAAEDAPPPVAGLSGAR